MCVSAWPLLIYQSLSQSNIQISGNLFFFPLKCLSNAKSCNPGWWLCTICKGFSASGSSWACKNPAEKDKYVDRFLYPFYLLYYIYIYIAHTTDSTIPWHVGKRRYPTIARNTLFIRCMSHDQGLSSADHALNNLTKYELPSAHILRLCREVCLGLWTLTMQMWFQMFLGSRLLRFPIQEAKSLKTAPLNTVLTCM